MRLMTRWARLTLLLPLSVAGCGGSTDRLPSADPSAVASIEAELDTWGVTPGRFTVAAADYGRVLQLFEGGVVDRHPLPWVVVGAVWITYADGRAVPVHLYRTYDGPGAYKVGRTYYRGSTDEAILGTITDCHKRSAPQPNK